MKSILSCLVVLTGLLSVSQAIGGFQAGGGGLPSQRGYAGGDEIATYGTAAGGSSGYGQAAQGSGGIINQAKGAGTGGAVKNINHAINSQNFGSQGAYGGVKGVNTGFGANYNSGHTKAFANQKTFALDTAYNHGTQGAILNEQGGANGYQSINGQGYNGGLGVYGQGNQGYYNDVNNIGYQNGGYGGQGYTKQGYGSQGGLGGQQAYGYGASYPYYYGNGGYYG